MSFGVYGIQPGTVLRIKKPIKAAKNKLEYYSILLPDQNIPIGSLITVLEIDELFETVIGVFCRFWFYHEDKKWYTSVSNNNFYDELEKIL